MYITNSLVTIIKPLEKNFTPKQNMLIGTALQNYVLRLEYFNVCTRICRKFTTTQDRFFLRLKCLDTFDFSIRYKHAVYFIALKNIRTYSGKLQVFKDFGLNEIDMAFYMEQPKHIMQQIKEMSYSIIDHTFKPEQVIHDCNKVLSDIDLYITKYVHRKLRFILTSNNLEAHDIINELRTKAVQTYFFYTLFITPEHRINSVKRSVVSHGTNLIHRYTTKAHGRLRSSGNGYENLCQSLTVVTGDGVEYDNFGIDEITNEASHSQYIDSKLTIDKMLKTYSGKQQKFAKLLCGQKDNKFVRYYNSEWSNSKYRFTDIEDIQDHSGDNYINCVQNYLGINDKKVKLFINTIKRDLAVA